MNRLLLLIICQNPLACSITNSELISKVLNGSTPIPMELLKFITVLGGVEVMGLPVCWMSSMDAHQPALNSACHSNTHVQYILSCLNACLITARVSITLLAVPLLDPLLNSIRPIT
jgi:hypothetical protein